MIIFNFTLKLMNKNPLNKGIIEKNSVGVGEVSKEMVEQRAKELALIAGRAVNLADQDQALRELSGGSAIDAKQELLGAVTEDQRLDPFPELTGHQIHESAGEEEDEDGQSLSIQLVEEGVSEAEHDQMLQAARAEKEQ